MLPVDRRIHRTKLSNIIPDHANTCTCTQGRTADNENMLFCCSCDTWIHEVCHLSPDQVGSTAPELEGKYTCPPCKATPPVQAPPYDVQLLTAPYPNNPTLRVSMIQNVLRRSQYLPVNQVSRIDEGTKVLDLCIRGFDGETGPESVPLRKDFHDYGKCTLDSLSTLVTETLHDKSSPHLFNMLTAKDRFKNQAYFHQITGPEMHSLALEQTQHLLAVDAMIKLLAMMGPENDGETFTRGGKVLRAVIGEASLQYHGHMEDELLKAYVGPTSVEWRARMWEFGVWALMAMAKTLGRQYGGAKYMGHGH